MDQETELPVVQPAYAAEALPPLPWGPTYDPKGGINPPRGRIGQSQFK